eukprot:symbB.v1.2.008219.t1/scaffold497.1/size195672/1
MTRQALHDVPLRPSRADPSWAWPWTFIDSSEMEKVRLSELFQSSRFFIRLVSLTLLAFLAIWCTLRASLSQDVVWMRQAVAGKKGKDSGRYCDNRCDQLTTRVEETSCCASIFPLRWAAVAADVKVIELAPRKRRWLAVEGEDEDSEVEHLLPSPSSKSRKFKGSRVSDESVQIDPDMEVKVQVLATTNSWWTSISEAKFRSVTVTDFCFSNFWNAGWFLQWVVLASRTFCREDLVQVSQ